MGAGWTAEPTPGPQRPKDGASKRPPGAESPLCQVGRRLGCTRWEGRGSTGSPWTGSTSAGRSDTASPRSLAAATFEAFSCRPPRCCCCHGCRSGQRSGGRPRTAASAAAAPYPCPDTTEEPARQEAGRSGLAGPLATRRNTPYPSQLPPNLGAPSCQGRAGEMYTLFPKVPSWGPTFFSQKVRHPPASETILRPGLCLQLTRARQQGAWQTPQSYVRGALPFMPSQEWM